MMMMVMMVITIMMIKIQDNEIEKVRRKTLNLRYLFQGGKK